MWVFGYGSLMWDNNWEQPLGCLRKKIAVLQGYERIFNKPSIKYWGTTNNPCPTLNVVLKKRASCKGMAFEFPDKRQQEIWTYLSNREKGFDLPYLPIKFCVSSGVKAIVPIYQGNNILNKTIEELTDMTLIASGSKGCCIGYVLNLEEKLHSLKIYDPTVIALANRIHAKKCLT